MRGKFNSPFLTGVFTSAMALYGAHDVIPERIHIVAFSIAAGAMLGWGAAKWQG